jgi:hypothetical protein
MHGDATTLKLAVDAIFCKQSQLIESARARRTGPIHEAEEKQGREAERERMALRW